MFSEKMIISIHPWLAGIADLAVGALLLWWIGNLSSAFFLLILFFLRLLWWAVLCSVTYFPAKISKLRHYFTLLVFSLGVTALLILVDWQFSWYLLGIIFVLASAVSFFIIPTKRNHLSFSFKPYRRFKLLLTAFGVFGVWGAVFASAVLRVISIGPLIIVWVLAALLSGVIALWWWQEYEIDIGRRALAAGGANTLVMFELAGVLVSWPVGYLVSAVLMVWFWYLLWLIIRFNLSTLGINWKRQAPFLVLNGIGMLCYLIFFVRWQ